MKQFLCLLLMIFPSLFRQPMVAQNPGCETCIAAVETFKSAVLGSDGLATVMTKLRSFFCSRMYPAILCTGMEELVFRPNYLTSLRTIDSEAVCSAIGVCISRFVPDRDKDFVSRVTKDTPASPKPNSAGRLLAPRKLLKLLTFGDVHIDFGYQENRTGVCDLPTCCRKECVWANGSAQAAGKFGSIGICDLPQVVFDSFVDFARNEIDPDLMLYLGDNTARNVWEITKNDHLDATRYISNAVTERFLSGAKSKFYPTMGNHEGFPYDQFDVRGTTHQWILDSAAEMWTPWLTPAALSEFRSTGSYSQLHPGTSLRILAINPFVMLNDNVYIWDDSTDPLDTLRWLERTLAESERTHESVIILSHVPPYTEPTNPHWSERYLALMERYAGIIKAQMFGHVHEGYFTVMKGQDGGEAGIGHVNPALTTSQFINPSFRVYEMDAETYEMTDYVEYRMNVSEANKFGKARWYRAHRFTEFYGVPDMSRGSFELVKRKINEDPKFWRKTLTARYQEGPLGEKMFNNTAIWKAKRCDYEEGSITSLAKCKGIMNASTDVCYDYEFVRLMVCKPWRRLALY
ncbi:MAG: metallophosphoesterase [Candidatus Pacebacteria bacterium]|nr:metallophosphoesterase [Candidatus Paceibacterota bacterium]